MQNFVSATSICAGTRTVFNKCALVASKEKDFFPFLDRVVRGRNSRINNVFTVYDFGI